MVYNSSNEKGTLRHFSTRIFRMVKIITDQGEYNLVTFKGDNGTANTLLCIREVLD